VTHALIVQANALRIPLPDESVQCAVTSPPYWGLRDYGIAGQLGLEPTPDEYIAGMVAVFREVWRVMKPNGTLWVNIGDSYAIGTKGGVKSKEGDKNFTSKGTVGISPVKSNHGVKDKDLVGIPWMLAFALRSDGWYLRSDIIWSKPNPMPESVTDRPTKAHEYIFLLSKSDRYYYDHEAIKEPATFYDRRLDNPDWQPPRKDRDQIGAPSRGGGPLNNRSKRDSFKREGSKRETAIPFQAVGTHRPDREESAYDIGERNKRSVWSVATAPYKGAHFATFPPKLIEPCILAGSRVGDLVLDPFNGSGTTGMMALKHNRRYVGVELNPKYIEMTHRRLAGVQPTLLEVST